MADEAGQPGLFASAKGLLHTLVETARTRLSLLASDLEEQGALLLQVAVLAALAAFCLALAAVLAVFFIIILFWDGHRLMATGVLFATFAAGAAVFGLLARSALATRPKLLAGTLDELRKDAEHLK